MHVYIRVNFPWFAHFVLGADQTHIGRIRKRIQANACMKSIKGCDNFFSLFFRNEEIWFRFYSCRSMKVLPWMGETVLSNMGVKLPKGFCLVQVNSQNLYSAPFLQHFFGAFNWRFKEDNFNSWNAPPGLTLTWNGTYTSKFHLLIALVNWVVSCRHLFDVWKDI